MGKVKVNIGGSGLPPFNGIIREISESSGNRCTNCTNLPLGESIVDVNLIGDSQTHTYLVTILNDAGCSAGVGQFTINCSCPNIPTVVASYNCEANNVVMLVVTPSVIGGGQLRTIVKQNGSNIYNDVISSGDSVMIQVSNGLTYEITAEINGQPNCRSSVHQVTPNCGGTCSITVTLSNPQC